MTARKLLCVTHYFESHHGGIELVAGRLLRELNGLGFDTLWAAAATTPPPPGDQVRALPLRVWNAVERKTGLPMPLPGLSAFRKLYNATAQADVIMVHDALYLTSVMALLTARWLGKPVVLVQHVGSIPTRNPLLSCFLRIANRFVTLPMLKAADQTVFISETTKAAFPGALFRRPPRLIFNGVDTLIFRPAKNASEREADRAAAGLLVEDPVALFVGRFVEKKGLLRLRVMAAARPNIRFAFAGWGPVDPTSWGLPNVSVHAGLAGDSLARLYRAADLLILPSTSEGFALVIQEALATGLPVVCGDEATTADPAASPFLSGAKVSIHDDQRTAAAFLQTIDKVLERCDDEDAQRARVAFAGGRYSWNSCALQHAGILYSLADVNERARRGVVGARTESVGCSH